jgi:magnesium-transporting ATPase (P-type)
MFDSDNHSNGLALDKYKKLNGKKGLLTSLKTSEGHGIVSDDSHLMADRMNTYGSNASRPIKIKTLWELIKEQLDDTTMKILIAATFVSLSIGIWRDLEAYYGHNTIVLFSKLNTIGA